MIINNIHCRKLTPVGPTWWHLQLGSTFFFFIFFFPKPTFRIPKFKNPKPTTPHLHVPLSYITLYTLPTPPTFLTKPFPIPFTHTFLSLSLTHIQFNSIQMAKLICSVFVLALLFAATAAKNSSPAPAVDCSSVILEMADCLSYVTADGTASRPEGNCCSGLKSVLKTNAECLCEAFRNSAQLGVTLNMTKAMALPSACHVAAPSVSNCGSKSPFLQCYFPFLDYFLGEKLGFMFLSAFKNRKPVRSLLLH